MVTMSRISVTTYNLCTCFKQQILLSSYQNNNMERMYEELPAKLKIQAPCSSRFVFNLVRISLCPFTVYYQAHLPPLLILEHQNKKLKGIKNFLGKIF